jgi:hypothetical protein
LPGSVLGPKYYLLKLPFCKLLFITKLPWKMAA